MSAAKETMENASSLLGEQEEQIDRREQRDHLAPLR